MTLKKQTLSGLIWTFTDTFLIRGGAFIASLVLARLLGPKEFGLIGMIAIFVSIGTTLVDSGLSSSLVRSSNTDDKDLSTVFWVNLLISIGIYILLFCAAPFIAKFYSQDILINIIRVYCITFILSAFTAVQLSILSKKMDFKKIMIYNIPGTIIGITVGITLGYLGFGVWSLVYMYLSTQVVQSFVLWFFSDWKPSFVFSREKLKLHFNFGYKLMTSVLIDTVFKNIYNILIGRFYSLKSLGFYERALMFNEYPVTVLTSIISKVSYPLLASIQSDQEKISAVYKQLLQVSFFATAPLMLGAAAIANPLFHLVLGTQWLPAVPFFQILCFASIFYPVHSFNINVLMVYGRTDLFLKLEIIKKVIIVVSILVFMKFGIYGLVWSSVFTSFMALLVNTHYSANMIKYKTSRQLLDILPVLLISLGMAYTIYSCVTLLASFSLILQVVIPAIAGIIFYVLINHLFKIKPYMYCLHVLLNRNK